jgi:tRNA(Leu) C34 or U34 (ribose-2'-O)-methylase TrmL
VPEGNTGNVIRLTVNTATELSRGAARFPRGRSGLKRAGLDYHEYAREGACDFAACRAALDRQSRRWYALTTTGAHSPDARFSTGDVLVFGRETAGLWTTFSGSSIPTPVCYTHERRPEPESVECGCDRGLRNLRQPVRGAV